MNLKEAWEVYCVTHDQHGPGTAGQAEALDAFPGHQGCIWEFRSWQEDDESDLDQALIEAGYIWCRPHEEWHRPPECPIDQAGNTIAWWGDDND